MVRRDTAVVYVMEFISRALRCRVLVWVLIGLMPIQGIAAGVFASLGSAHVHRAAEVVQVQLEDFRRSPARIAPRDTHVAQAFGHFHSAEPARHHHSPGDLAVVRIADDAANQIGDGNESTLSPALGALTSIIPCVATWLAPALAEVMASKYAWPLITHDTEPLERPPRRA